MRLLVSVKVKLRQLRLCVKCFRHSFKLAFKGSLHFKLCLLNLSFFRHVVKFISKHFFNYPPTLPGSEGPIVCVPTVGSVIHMLIILKVLGHVRNIHVLRNLHKLCYHHSKIRKNINLSDHLTLPHRSHKTDGYHHLGSSRTDSIRPYLVPYVNGPPSN